MWKHILLYAAFLALGAFALQWLDLQRMARLTPQSVYDGLLAAGFLALGLWLGARVLGRLRKLGRRRRAAPVRPASGWSSLDDTERAIANLVAKGQTNRQISTQLFMSPHTVNFHLRKIFRKLEISSRVELVMRSRDDQ